MNNLFFLILSIDYSFPHNFFINININYILLITFYIDCTNYNIKLIYSFII